MAQEVQQNSSSLQEQLAAAQQQLSSREAALAEARDSAACVQSQLGAAVREVSTFTGTYSLTGQAAAETRPADDKTPASPWKYVRGTAHIASVEIELHVLRLLACCEWEQEPKDSCHCLH